MPPNFKPEVMQYLRDEYRKRMRQRANGETEDAKEELVAREIMLGKRGAA